MIPRGVEGLGTPKMHFLLLDWLFKIGFGRPTGYIVGDGLIVVFAPYASGTKSRRSIFFINAASRSVFGMRSYLSSVCMVYYRPVGRRRLR